MFWLRLLRDHERVLDLVMRLQSELASAREKVAAWMVANGLATGHGDTLDDLLSELTWQWQEMRDRLASARQEGKDEGLEEAAKILEGSDTNNVGMPHPHDVKVAAVIRSHKATGTPPAIPKEAEKGRIE